MLEVARMILHSTVSVQKLGNERFTLHFILPWDTICKLDR